MKPYAQKAAELRLQLEAGIVTSKEVVAWADGLIAQQSEYDENLVEISLGAQKSFKDLLSALSKVALNADRWQALRSIMPLMYDVLLKDRSKVHDFSGFLFDQIIENGQDVPQDLSWLSSITREYGAAVDKISGSLEQITDSLLKHLSQYKKS